MKPCPCAGRLGHIRSTVAPHALDPVWLWEGIPDWALPPPQANSSSNAPSGTQHNHKTQQPWGPFLVNAVRAKTLYIKDVDYVVQGKEVKIINQQTGRVQEESRWTDNIHQVLLPAGRHRYLRNKCTPGQSVQAATFKQGVARAGEDAQRSTSTRYCRQSGDYGCFQSTLANLPCGNHAISWE